MSGKLFAVGVDVGGSHISSAIIDLKEMGIVKNSLVTVNVDNHAEASEILNIWSANIQSLVSQINPEDLAGIGLAMPGPFDYANGIALFESRKYQKLFGINIREEMRTRLGLDESLVIRFINDAIAFAIGECWMGKAKEAKRAVAITLGTGFGSAFLEHGIPIVEGEEVPKSGCVWHMPYHDGIADDSFSTRWFTNNYLERSGKSLPGVKEIATLYESDVLVRELFHEFGNNLAEFLSPSLTKFEAEILVIGGNIGGAYQLFGPSFLRGLKDRQVITVSVLSELKEDAALIGGARLLDHQFWLRIKDLLPGMS